MRNLRIFCVGSIYIERLEPVLQLLFEVHVADVVFGGLHLELDHLLDGLALAVEVLHLLSTEFGKSFLQLNN